MNTVIMDNHTSENPHLSQENEAVAAPKKPFWKRALRFTFRFFMWFIIVTVLWVIVLRWLPVFFTPLMVSRSIEGYFSPEKDGKIYYEWTSLDKISPDMAVAVIASEDQRYFTHYGFDWASIKQAMEENKTRKIKRGASSISQQVAKNVFLWNGRGNKVLLYTRKGLEAYFTVLIETFWGKKRIMEVYLNIAEMGNRTFGVQAASKRFFGKDASKINTYEAARLAAVLPNPRVYSAQYPNWYVQTRQAQVQRQMYLLGGRTFLQWK